MDLFRIYLLLFKTQYSAKRVQLTPRLHVVIIYVELNYYVTKIKVMYQFHLKPVKATSVLIYIIVIGQGL